jgi:hypothetical protein
MRLAVTILSLLLMLVVGLQSCAASVGGSLSSNQATSSAAAVGMLVALLFLVGGAFAIAYPLVSLVSFVLAGLFALVGGTSSVSDFKDLQVWGFVALILALLSYFGVREKRRRVATEHQRVR